jgi:hypothetical protein
MAWIDYFKKVNEQLAMLLAGTTEAGGAIPARVVADGGGSLTVDLAAVTAVVAGQKTVTTAGSHVALGSSTTLKSGVRVKALHGNTGWIYVGPDGVTSTTGCVLDAGEEVFVEVNDLATVYIDASVNGEGVSFIGG